jgi:hypothetical protein
MGPYYDRCFLEWERFGAQWNWCWFFKFLQDCAERIVTLCTRRIERRVIGYIYC